MTLKQFLDMWTRKNRTLILCKDKFYDDMFDDIDRINEGELSVEDIKQSIICAVIPQLTDYIEGYYLRDMLNEAEVTEFFIGEKEIIVWIKLY